MAAEHAENTDDRGASPLLCERWVLPPPLGIVSSSFGEARRSVSGAAAAVNVTGRAATNLLHHGWAVRQFEWWHSQKTSRSRKLAAVRDHRRSTLAYVLSRS